MKYSPLPVLRDGDRVAGEPCIQPAHLSFCEGCMRMRRSDRGEWRYVRDAFGSFRQFCPRHTGSDEELLSQYDAAYEEDRVWFRQRMREKGYIK